MIWLALALAVVWWALGPWVLAVALGALLIPRVRRWVRERTHFTRRGLAYAGCLVALVTGVVLVVPDGWLSIPPSAGVLVTPKYLGRPQNLAAPIRAVAPPQNPHLTRNGANSMHNDAAASDAYSWAGPSGVQPEVKTAWYGVEECATLAFDSQERLVGLCGDLQGPTMHVIDPDSMRKLASKDLPGREKTGKRPWEDICGGAYFYLDDRDRAVVATTDRRIMAINTADADGRADLTTAQTWDLADVVPDEDCLIALLPDWSGRIWFETLGGIVGTIDADGGEPRVLDLEEEIANSFATDETGGVYVVTTHALYRLEPDAEGAPTVGWRSAYDRGSELKTGQLSQGSGTIPTIIDGGLIAITDNADPRMNVVFYERASGREVCRRAVFGDGASATENSLVSVGGGVIVENNDGYAGPQSTALGLATTGGFARVDVAGGDCKLVWTNDVAAPTSVPKVSWANGLLYAYTKRPTWWGVSAWYLTAMDARTGHDVFSVLTGTGILMNNHYAAITIAPDGAVWIATLGGLVRIRDRQGTSSAD